MFPIRIFSEKSALVYKGINYKYIYFTREYIFEYIKSSTLDFLK